MGKGRRARPRLLGKKLSEIRAQFGLSQNEMLKRLGLEAEFSRAELSAYERGVREPPLQVLLSYSETARIWVNVLIDDRLDLPTLSPGIKMKGGIERVAAKRAK